MTSASPRSTSRAASDELLAGLRAGQWRPAAWARFVVSSARRSVQQAVQHPRALTEVTVLHAALALAAGGHGRRWVAASWAMAATHLGMLEARSSLGAASLVTLLRANLPALGARAARHPALVRWLPALALASDLADGRIARRAETVTAFGTHADSLADAAFWTWFTLRHEPSRPVRILALAAWAAPVAVVTSASIARGQMTDPPRPEMLRPAAALQAIVTVRAALRSGTTLDGRVFQTARGGILQDSGYNEVWDQARREALTPAQYRAPLGRRPCDLRHAAVSLWLNSGVPATEVARRAGHGGAVLLKIYAHCIDGQATAANQRIAEVLGIGDAEDDPGDEGDGDAEQAS